MFIIYFASVQRGKKHWLQQPVTAILIKHNLGTNRKKHQWKNIENKNGKKNNLEWGTIEIANEMTWTWLRRRNLKRETEHLLIETQNNAIRTNYVKVKIDNKQKNGKYRLCVDIDETFNHKISKSSERHKRNIRLGSTGWETWSTENCARLKFDHTEKW